MMTVRIESITPEKATEMLARNTNNRRMNDDAVAYYMSQIERGKWLQNGETIKVAQSGMLLDGHHRLEAVRLSGKPMDLMVVRGLEDEVAMTIDTGRARGPADHLRIYGFKHDTNVLAAAAMVAMRFDKDGKFKERGGKIAPWEIIEFVEKHKQLQYSMARIPSAAGRLAPRSMCVALHYIFSTYVSPSKAELFFDAYVTGAELKRGSPVLALRTRLIEMRNQGVSMSSKGTRGIVIYYFVQAFKAYCEGREIKHLLHKEGTQADLEASL